MIPRGQFKESKDWQSVDFQFNLVPPKLPEKSTSFTCVHRNVFTERLLFVDMELPKTPKESYLMMSFNELLEVKESKKKYFKRLMRDYTLVSTPSNASRILKSIGKILQRYNKTPILTVNTAEVSVHQRKQYVRLEEKRMQGKLGNVREESSILEERLNSLSEGVRTRGYVIKKILLKSSQGRLHAIDPS